MLDIRHTISIISLGDTYVPLPLVIKKEKYINKVERVMQVSMAAFISV